MLFLSPANLYIRGMRAKYQQIIGSLRCLLKGDRYISYFDMYYVLWTNTGSEEKTRQMINEFADPALFTRCLIPYRLKRHYFKGKSHIAKLILFPSYVFIETDRIKAAYGRHLLPAS